MANILEVENLKMYYASKMETVKAVDDVSFSLKEGETFGLVGESGCGKSATCRTILRLMPHPGKVMGGSIRYKGTDLLRLKEREMRKIRGKEISMIFQDPMTALNPVLKVKAQMFEALKDQGLSKKQMYDRGVELLRLVDIPEPEKRMEEYVHQFSGGMRQRAMIAIALASNPKLLLADEPTTALDVTIQDQIIRLINRLKRELGMSIILITHDLGVVNQMCDQVAVMYAGHIVEVTDTDTLFARPEHPYTRGLINSLPGENDQRERLEPIPGAPPNLAEQIPGCPFAPRCKYASAACENGLPEMREISAGHRVRCLYAGNLPKAKEEKVHE